MQSEPVDDEGPCTDCWDTGVTTQTERPCSCGAYTGPAAAPDGLDWKLIAKAAGEHGIRYRTNTALARFLAEIGFVPADRITADAAEKLDLHDSRTQLFDLLAVIHRDGGQTIDTIGPKAAWEQAMQISSERIAALAELKRLVYVPGAWRCVKCNFTLIQSNLNTHDGSVTARDEPGDKCPNDGALLWRVSYKQWAAEQGEMAEAAFERQRAALAERDTTIARLTAEIERRAANENRNCINWGPCSAHDDRMSESGAMTRTVDGEAG